MKPFQVALQLYSVREEMEKDMPGTLRAVKAMGYDFVEFAGYGGRTAEEVRALLAFPSTRVTRCSWGRTAARRSTS